jgi:hypothetical protein
MDLTFVTDAARRPVLWMLLAFVVTFLVTRGITRHIRARSAEPREDESGRSLIGDITIGGVHVHHQVWGILLVLVSALMQFAYEPDAPWAEILGALFGIGAALTLDEFALWLHLDDVYWSKEGRKSIDAVLLGASICALLLIGTSPFGVEGVESEDVTGYVTLAVVLAVDFAAAVVAFMKGKLILGAIGLFVPFVAWVAAIRLARPGSPWARRRYRERPRKLARAIARFERHDARMERLRDLLGGAPSGG